MDRLLEALGYDVRIVKDGAQALEALKEARFDLVMMDVQMPVMDGLEATRAIRSGDAGEAVKDIPILALTATDDAREVRRFLECGMNDHLSKPVDIEALQDKITQLLGSAS